MHYIPSSADDGVSGHGPYQRACPPKFYFSQRATPKFHSEMGMPNIVTMDSLKQMMPEESMWPQGTVWGIHDFTLAGAQGGASFREPHRQQLRRSRQRRRLGVARAVRELRRLSRHVRGAEQEPHGPADLDEPPHVALLRLADLRLLPRAHRRLLRRQEGLRAAAHPVEPRPPTASKW